MYKNQFTKSNPIGINEVEQELINNVESIFVYVPDFEANKTAFELAAKYNYLNATTQYIDVSQLIKRSD